MELKYTQYGTGEKKILITDGSYGINGGDLINLNKNNDYSIFFLEKDQFSSFFKHNITGNVSVRCLNKTYNNGGLKVYYNKIIDFCKSNNIHHILFTHTGQYWHPDFLNELKNAKIKICLFTMDDDYSRIKKCSLPYTKYYDYHFHVGVMFDKNGKTIADKLREYGGNPVRIPYGYFSDHVNSFIDFYNRDIDICYIGNINPYKFIRLSRLKRHFGERLKLFGQQGNGDRKSLKGIFYKISNKIFKLGYIEPVSDEKLKEIYKRTKIGFNLHLCPRKGPSNLRLYELPANGVMEICDNDLGMRKIFNVGKEIVTYKGISDAISKIEYYLQHEDERIQLAKQGYKKTINNYTFENGIKKMFDVIF